MNHGFDLNDPLICEGIIGDGCGGGRLFMIQDAKLKAYDPTIKSSKVLLEGIEKALRISKKVCIITIVCEDSNIEFDLSKMRKV